jgi:hypothetical protein
MAQPFQLKSPTNPTETARKAWSGNLDDLGVARVERPSLASFLTALLSQPREGFRGRPRRQNVLVYEAARVQVKPMKLHVKTAKPPRDGLLRFGRCGNVSTAATMLGFRVAFCVPSDAFDSRTARKF